MTNTTTAICYDTLNTSSLAGAERHLEARLLYRAAERRTQMPGQKVREGTQDLENGLIEILQGLACAAENRYDNSGHHTHRVGDLAASLGRFLHFPESRVESIRIAASLHDVGKIAIPDRILM